MVTKRRRILLPKGTLDEEAGDDKGADCKDDTRQEIQMFIAASLPDADAIIIRNPGHAEEDSVERQLVLEIKDLDPAGMVPMLRSTEAFAISRALAARHQKQRQEIPGLAPWAMYLSMLRQEYGREYI